MVDGNQSSWYLPEEDLPVLCQIIEYKQLFLSVNTSGPLCLCDTTILSLPMRTMDVFRLKS